MRTITILTALSLILASCSPKDKPVDPTPAPNPTPTPEPQPVVTYDAWTYTTKADGSQLFVEGGLNYLKTKPSEQLITLTDETFQTVDGFGAALTVSSCFNLMKMSQENRTAFLKETFDPKEGAGSSLVRIAIGGCDFSWDYSHSSGGRFTWCDEKGIENFAPHELDVEYVLPILKEVFAINPDVKIIGSPWTAPRWMKLDANLKESASAYSWTGGRLNPEYYADYGEYFVKWIQYFEKEGFPIYAVTPQNEPLNAGNSMSMLMPWEDCRDFIKKGLGPALEKAGLKTKILIFDHNYNYDDKSDQKSYPLKVYADEQASKYIAGSAWHNYGGKVSELDNIVKNAPDKEIYFTEASIGTWNYDFASCLITDFKDIFIGTLSRGGKGVTLWNLMLDEKKGPYTNFPGSCTTCFGASNIVSTSYTKVEHYSHWYQIAHASKVIRPGAVRIGTTGTVSGVDILVFRNPDNSYGAVMVNSSNDPRQPSFVGKNHTVRCSVPAKSIVSLSWKD